MTAAVLGRLFTRARERGLRATAKKVFEDHLYRRSSSVVMEYRHDWGGGAARAFTPDPDVSFAMVQPGDAVPPLAPFLSRRRADFERMLADGKVGMFVADADGAFGCVWLSFSDHRDDASREFYRVAPGEAYHYCWLLDPERRRSTAALDTMRFMFAAARERGVTRQFGVIDRVNRPSYQIHKRFNYREAGIEVIHRLPVRARWTFTRRYKGTLGLHPPRRADLMATAAPAERARAGPGLVRSTLVVAAIRGVDFGLSFLVSVLLAGRFGAGAQLDAFFLARRTTVGFADMIRKLVVQVLMPSVVARVDRGGALSVHGLPRRLYLFVGGFALLTVIGMLIPSLLVTLFAPGFHGLRHDLTATMMAVMMPLLPLSVVGSMLVAVLQANRRYWVSEGNNLIQRGMLVAVLAVAVPPLGIVAGAWTMLAAGLVGFAILVAGSWSIVRRHPSALLRRERPSEPRDLESDVPGVGGGVAAAVVLNIYLQATSLLDFAAASLTPDGGVAALEYGSRLVTLIPGLMMSSLSTVMLPELIREMQRRVRDPEVLARYQRMVIFAQVPISIGMMLGADVIVHILFGRGAFDERSIALASGACQGYALAQVFLAPMTAITSAIYADPRKSCLKDLATIAVGGLTMRALAIWIGASIAGAPGIAWGAAASTFATAVLTHVVARRRFEDIGFAGFGRDVARIALCGGIATGCAWLFMASVGPFDAVALKLARLTALGAIVMLVYAGAALALRVPEVLRLRATLARAVARRLGRA